jgi:hypothetical protein
MDQPSTQPSNVFYSLEEAGKLYEVELLDPPVVRGAGPRYYRLWCDKRPCTGAQYHYDLDSAVSSIKRLAAQSYLARIQVMQTQISYLERSHRLVNSQLGDKELPVRGADAWAEVKQLLRMHGDPALTDEDREGQAKRVRVMLLALGGDNEN